MPNQYTYNPNYPSQEKWLIAAVASHQSDDCLIWPFRKDAAGYGVITFRRDGRRVYRRVHRVAFFFANGHWPTPQANHTCDVRSCLNPRHLVEGTQKDNVHDCIDKGRFVYGEANGNSKMTAQLVREFRSEFIAGSRTHGSTALAKKYGISKPTAYLIGTRRTWKHV